jgi:hypothetical protein
LTEGEKELSTTVVIKKKKKGTQIKYKKVVVVFSHGKVVYTRAPTKNVVFTTRIEQNVSQ